MSNPTKKTLQEVAEIMREAGWTGNKESSPMSATTSAGAVQTPDISKPAGKSFVQALFDHPIGFWFIFWGEFAERSSYYGMRAIMTSYMIDRLGMSTANAGSYYFMFVAGCYLTPLIGGFIADNYLGKYKTIVFFSLPYILGHVVLGIENLPCLFIAMLMLCMGSGVIKPNVSTLMGMTYDQQRPGNDELRTTAFSLYYMAVNIGAALSQIAIPWIRTNHGYQIAFLFPAILMAIAFVIFAVGKRFYAHETISHEKATPEENALKWQILGRIGGLFLLVTFFWAIFDQASSTWIIFGRLYQDTSLFGYHIDVEQVQATNAILIVVMTPLFAAFWAIMRSKGVIIRATDKIVAGFLLTGLCMGIMAYPALTAGPIETTLVPLGKVTSEGEAKEKLDKEAMPRLYAGMIANAGNPMLSVAEAVNTVGTPMQGTKLFVKPENKATIWWQVLAFFIITVAEILISITGLELAFVAAPKTMKSFVTSLWLLTVFAANVFNSMLAQLYPNMNPGYFFLLLVGLMMVVAFCFYFVALRFNRIVAEQDAAAKSAALSSMDGMGGPGGVPIPSDGPA